MFKNKIDKLLFEMKVRKDDTTVLFQNQALGILGIYYWKNKIFLLLDTYRYSKTLKNDDYYAFGDCYKVNSINIDEKQRECLICLKVIKTEYIKREKLDNSNLRNLVITCIIGIEKIFEKEILDEIYFAVGEFLSIVIKDSFYNNNKPIFEDKYAWHYRYDNGFNLKVYKQNSEIYNYIDEIEENIDAMGHSYIGQDCFYPVRKAVDISGKLIGYIYEKFKFGKDCIDLGDKKLNNLARIKGLIRLITQISEARFDIDFYFICNSPIHPLTYVFINKNHKHQVQILNLELLMLKPDYMESYVYEYIRTIINSNDDIKVNIPAYNESQDSLVEIKDKLQNLNYCSKHNVCYDGIECPECKEGLEYIEKFAKFNEKDILKKAKSEITNQSQLNEGGEAIIYPYPQKRKSVAKVFKEGKIDYVFKQKVLEKILSKKEILKDINNQNAKYKYIFPQKILLEKKNKVFYGYTMTRIKGKPLSVLRDKKVVKELGFNKKDVLEILITVGEGIETLHQKANIYIGDLNGRNILFDEDKNVYFLDFDGMGVDDLAPAFYTEGYIDPTSQKNKNITRNDDWYSFAIQAFYYLTFTHPFNGIYKNLSIVERMERKISLLGKHNVKPPAIAEKWNWMDKKLLKAFLNTFEGDTRRSIVPELKAQYTSLERDVIRVNSQFVARKLNDFDFLEEDIEEKESNCDIFMWYLCEEADRIIVCREEYRSDGYMFNYIPDKNKNSVIVVDNKGKCFIVLDTLETRSLSIPVRDDDINIDTVVFNKGILYIPSNNCLYLISVYDQSINKKVECNKIMTPNSKIFNFNEEGFSVITNDVCYEVRKR